MGKKEKKCSNKNKRIFWYALTISGLGLRALAAIALVLIAFQMTTLKKEANFFNSCVEENNKNGLTISTAVNICSGCDN